MEVKVSGEVVLESGFVEFFPELFSKFRGVMYDPICAVSMHIPMELEVNGYIVRSGSLTLCDKMTHLRIFFQ